MGLLLDSSVVIAAERQRQSAATLISRVLATCGDQPIALAAPGYTELVHGIHRSQTPLQRAVRTLFLHELIQELPVLSYTREMADVAGKASIKGDTIPFPDLLIGATALALNFAVLTGNVRHFQLIPGLEVVQF